MVISNLSPVLLSEQLGAGYPQEYCIVVPLISTSALHVTTAPDTLPAHPVEWPIITSSSLLYIMLCTTKLLSEKTSDFFTAQLLQTYL